ncbi:unnamed protein product [Sphagnum balticum]
MFQFYQPQDIRHQQGGNGMLAPPKRGNKTTSLGFQPAYSMVVLSLDSDLKEPGIHVIAHTAKEHKKQVPSLQTNPFQLCEVYRCMLDVPICYTVRYGSTDMVHHSSGVLLLIRTRLSSDI